MKVLVVYDSVSATKMTAKVAEIIGEGLKGKGLDVDTVFCKDVNAQSMGGYECFVVGSPTMAWKPTKAIIKFLDGLDAKEVGGKRAAAFDTQIESRMSGNAAKGMEKRIVDLGMTVVTSPLLAYVEGKTDQYRLKDGEPERIRNWAEGLADILGK